MTDTQAAAERARRTLQLYADLSTRGRIGPGVARDHAESVLALVAERDELGKAYGLRCELAHEREDALEVRIATLAAAATAVVDFYVDDSGQRPTPPCLVTLMAAAAEPKEPTAVSASERFSNSVACRGAYAGLPGCENCRERIRNILALLDPLEAVASLADAGHDADAHEEHPPEDGRIMECALCAALAALDRARKEQG